MHVLHKFSRYALEEKIFIVYLLVLAFFFLVSPVISFKLGSISDAADGVRLMSGTFFKTGFTLFLALLLLL